MTFSVIFVYHLVVVALQIVSRKTRKYSNPSNERSERMSTQTAETVKDVRVLVSFYAAREDGNVSNELVHRGKCCVPVSDTYVTTPPPAGKPGIPKLSLKSR